MASNEQIRVPTAAVAATVSTSDGTTREVTVFLALASPSHGGPETIDEFLNSPRPFLPVKTSEGKPNLIGAESIRTFTVGADAPMLSRLPGRDLPGIHFVTLCLEDGTMIEGTLIANQPPDQRRVSDAFNAEGRFVPIETGGAVTYVQKSRITRVEV